MQARQVAVALVHAMLNTHLREYIAVGGVNQNQTHIVGFLLVPQTHRHTHCDSFASGLITF